tara:strand:- start:930 stop:1154 length:225 start_codon:yes stop_codon:yes gene_type:complete
MSLELLSLGGYGQFVWPAFIFAFMSCLVLFMKTKKELQKQEEIFFKEFKHLYILRAKSVKKKQVTEEAFSGNSI